MRIYWPLDVVDLERRNGYQPAVIIGWKNQPEDYVVVTTLPYLDPKIVDTLLQRDSLFAGTDHSPPQIYGLCGQKRLYVLGVLNCSELGNYRIDSRLIEARLDDTMKVPTHTTPGRRGFVQVIAYKLPRHYKMEYFSVYPVGLEISEKSPAAVIGGEYGGLLVQEQLHKDLLETKIKQHCDYDANGALEQGMTLRKCINQINCSLELGQLMRENAVKLFPKLAQRRRRRSSFGEIVVEGAISVNSGVWSVVDRAWATILPIILWMTVTAVMCGRILAEVGLQIVSTPIFRSAALKDVSAVAQQVDLRLQQFCFWPVQYNKLLKRRLDWSSNTDYNVEYIRFYNSIWLVINDIIFGVSFGQMILSNEEFIVGALEKFVDTVLTRGFTTNMLWLMDWPGGLKLNNELAQFLGELFLWVIQFWSSILGHVRPYFPLLVKTVGYSSFVGATYLLALVTDLLSILTLHVYWFYVASAKIYNWQLTALQSLFHIFRGKKRNLLRKRIDSTNYDLDQLLVGTVLFIVLIFLLPTVVVFYLSFAFSRLVSVLVCAMMEFALSCLNHFPLFSMMLRAKEPTRIPGGIEVIRVNNRRAVKWTDLFNLNDDDDNGNQDAGHGGESYVRLKPVPLTFGRMFRPFNLLSSWMFMHYFSVRVFKRFISGGFVPTQRHRLYIILHATLPDKPISIKELYRQLTQ
uniref:ARAD1D08624p n=1 Tax=Blastobotrys adeninivorans TaxID=409370 RepID=A0A060T945_BLAAD